MIHDHLIPALKSEFPDRDIVFDTPPQPIATFPANQDAVGKVMIYDDGDEATVSIEHISHSHFNPYDKTLTSEESGRLVTEWVIDFLDALFGDRILLYVGPDQRIGGFIDLDQMAAHGSQLPFPQVDLKAAGYRYFLWSRPYFGDDETA